MRINTIYSLQFAICLINDNNMFRFKQLFDRFLKYLCSLFIMADGLINCYALYVFIAFSWHICLKDIGQNIEIVFLEF